MSNDKPARQWAAEIAALPSLAQRRAAVSALPANIRPLVEAHLKVLWSRKHRHGRG
jgi:hypothetical protein